MFFSSFPFLVVLFPMKFTLDMFLLFPFFIFCFSSLWASSFLYLFRYSWMQNTKNTRKCIHKLILSTFVLLIYFLFLSFLFSLCPFTALSFFLSFLLLSAFIIFGYFLPLSLLSCYSSIFISCKHGHSLY